MENPHTADDDLIDGFLQHLLHQKRYSAHTAGGYGADCRSFSAYLLENKLTLMDAGSDDIRLWLGSQLGRASRPISARSASRKLSSLRALYNYMAQKGARAGNPAEGIRGPKLQKPLPTFYGETQMQHVLETPPAQSRQADWVELRNIAIIEVLYTCGIRLSELIGLKDADIQWAAPAQIKVMGKRSKQRIVPLIKSTAEAMHRYQAARNEYHPAPPSFFITENGAPLYPMLVSRVVKARLGPFVQGKISPHKLRHTFATHLLDNDADLASIKDLLGHAGLAATQVYTHTSASRLKKIHAQAHPRSGKN